MNISDSLQTDSKDRKQVAKVSFHTQLVKTGNNINMKKDVGFPGHFTSGNMENSGRASSITSSTGTSNGKGVDGSGGKSSNASAGPTET